jgi:hypothetical protein
MKLSKPTKKDFVPFFWVMVGGLATILGQFIGQNHYLFR